MQGCGPWAQRAAFSHTHSHIHTHTHTHTHAHTHTHTRTHKHTHMQTCWLLVPVDPTTPISRVRLLLRMLQAYTEPRARCATTAGGTSSHLHTLRQPAKTSTKQKVSTAVLPVGANQSTSRMVFIQAPVLHVDAPVEGAWGLDSIGREKAPPPGHLWRCLCIVVAALSLCTRCRLCCGRLCGGVCAVWHTQRRGATEGWKVMQCVLQRGEHCCWSTGGR